VIELDALGWNVITAAVAIAALHTALGPDHYLPFVMLARARRWSRRRTLSITAACGLGHVLSSVVLGLVGTGFGAALGVVEGVEAWRGTIAAWGLLAFGAAYAAWGIRHALRRRTGLELHRHGGLVHLHAHGTAGHAHGASARREPGEPARFVAFERESRALLLASRRDPSEEREVGRTTTFWALFVVFVLGPCEPLIPLFFLPASRGRYGLAAATAVVFSIVTIAVMLALVGLAHAGFERLAFQRLERWSHALAGGIVALSGLAVLAFGL
jgi:nickel/cobalt exporter